MADWGLGERSDRGVKGVKGGACCSLWRGCSVAPSSGVPGRCMPPDMSIAL